MSARKHLTAAALARPFRPFTIHTRDRRSIRVSHPEVISFPPGNTHMVVIAKPTGGVRLLILSAITAIERERAVDEPREARRPDACR